MHSRIKVVTVPEELRALVAPYVVEGQISCADAHMLAARQGMSPAEFGQALTEGPNIRIYRCDLGLFGYGSKAEGLSKVVQPARHVPPEVAAAFDSVARNGNIACSDVWRLAAQFSYPRLAFSNIAEAMGLKVRPCQLGCF